VTRSGDNVTGYTILTANNNGVSRMARQWNAWEDVRIARFYAIEGE